MAEVLKAPGSVTVATATAFAREIGDALARTDDLALDLDDLAELDLSAIQVVHAARLSAARSGKAIRLTGQAPAPVHALLERAGFMDSPSSEDLAFWCQGATPQ